MSIECYETSCEKHNKTEPFCDEEQCIKLTCGRCYEYVEELFPANCTEKPERLLGAPIGMYHCPDCGAMLLAGVPHPTLCKRCVDGMHPGFDFHTSNEPPPIASGIKWLSTVDNKVRAYNDTTKQWELVCQMESQGKPE